MYQDLLTRRRCSAPGVFLSYGGFFLGAAFEVFLVTPGAGTTCLIASLDLIAGAGAIMTYLKNRTCACSR